MVSTGLWTGESLVLGIVMIGVGLLLILVSMPLAKGQVRAHQYNYRPWQPIKLSDEEKDRLGRPTAKATIAVALLYALAGLASVAIGLTGHAGPGIMYLFIGSSVFLMLAFAAIAIVMVYTVKRWRKQGAAGRGEAKPPAAK